MNRFNPHPEEPLAGRPHDSVLDYQLGKIASVAGDPKRKDVGDEIDRGLILLKLLKEKGFTVYAK